MLEHSLLIWTAVFVFVEKQGHEHLESCLVYQVQRGHSCGDRSWLDLIAPDQLAAWLGEREVQFAREARFLDEEEEAAVNIFPEELLEGCLRPWLLSLAVPALGLCSAALWRDIFSGSRLPVPWTEARCALCGLTSSSSGVSCGLVLQSALLARVAP